MRLYLCLVSQYDMESSMSLDQVFRSIVSLSDTSVYTDVWLGSRTCVIILLELEFQLLRLAKMTWLKELNPVHFYVGLYIF